MIYFDNAATTRPSDSVIKAMDDINNNFYANPSAMHRFGFNAEQKVKESSEYIAKALNADPKEIYWTSGGSESNNLSIKGFVKAYGKVSKHIITTKIEHASVSKVFLDLEKDGCEVTFLNVDRDGKIDIDELVGAIREDTILVSIMLVNNEIGSVADIYTVGKAIKKKNNKTAFHVDAVQGFGKIKIDVKKANIDFLSISSHKFHGPKGVGILYKNKDLRLIPFILGGGQQDNLRSGTLNVPGIYGTYIAAKDIYSDFEAYHTYIKSLRDYMIDRIDELINQGFEITKNTQKSDIFAPHVVSISVKGVRSEVLLHAFEEKKIYVSAGSACSSHDKKISSTLKSIGLTDEYIESTIRISFSKYNTKEEIDIFIEVLKEIIKKYKLK